jgi:hypothetical protein
MFKKMVRSIIILVCATSIAHAGKDEECFLHATTLYKNHDWNGALRQYEKINAQGPAVWYGMGNCFFYTQQYADALVCWLRAKRESNSAITQAADKAIAHLAAVLHRPVSTTFFTQIYFFLAQKSATFSLLFLQLVSLFFWFLTWFFLRRYGLKKIFTSVLTSVQCICFLFLISFFATLLSVKYIEQVTMRGVVMQADTPVYAGPLETYQLLTTLPQAYAVTIRGTSTDWYKASYDTGMGWIKKDFITVV